MLLFKEFTSVSSFRILNKISYKYQYIIFNSINHLKRINKS